MIYFTFPSTMVTLLAKLNVDNFGEHEGSTLKSTRNDISLELGVNFISNDCSEFKL